MDLDDIAFGVIKEDLMPAVHGPGPVIRIGNALLVEALLEGGDVVGPEGDVSAVERIDRLPGPEADTEVLFCQVKLRGAVVKKCDLAGVALLRHAHVIERRLGLEIEN